MALIDEFYTPAELTGYARASLADRPANQPSLARFLPYRTIDDLEYRFVRGGEGLTEAATFRSWDTPSPVASRPGFNRVTGELAPISRQLRVDEYTRLRQRSNGNDRIREVILSDTERLVRQIEMRLEKARADALVAGTLTLNENGVAASIDYGRDAGHTVSAGTAWTDATNADALSDLRAWCDTYEATNGRLPGVILMSRYAMRLIMAQAKVRALLANAFGSPANMSRAQLNSTLDAYELPPIETYEVNYSVAGSTTRMIPQDKVLLLPAPVAPDGDSELGSTLIGTPAEALEADYDLADSDQPGIVAGNYKTDNPIAVWTNVSAVALPVLANPNLSFTADVA